MDTDSTTQGEADALAVVRGYHRAWNDRRFADARRYLSEHLDVEVPSGTSAAANMQGPR